MLTINSLVTNSSIKLKKFIESPKNPNAKKAISTRISYKEQLWHKKKNAFYVITSYMYLYTHIDLQQYLVLLRGMQCKISCSFI